MTKPLTVLKSVGPKLVPFFKTVTIFFVLFGEEGKDDSVIYCIFKCLPIISLIIFILLHGMNFSEAYAYSRKILIGLVFSMIGDCCLVWKNQGYFLPGIAFFGLSQLCYAHAFGFTPFKPWRFLGCTMIGSFIYMHMMPHMEGILVYIGAMYAALIFVMLWRAVARVQFLHDLWTWTKLCSFIGAIFFVCSDLIITLDRFITPVPYNHQIIMVTYYIAQLCITVSVVDSQVDHLLKKTQGNGHCANGQVEPLLKKTQ